jgi:hypothetical protein
VRVIDREVIRLPLAFGNAQDLGAGEMNYPLNASALGGQEHMPGAEHVDGHDLLGTARRVVGQRCKMHDRGTATGRMPDLAQVQQVHAVSAVKSHDLVAKMLQMTGYRAADVPAMPGDEDAHTTIQIHQADDCPGPDPRVSPGRDGDEHRPDHGAAAWRVTPRLSGRLGRSRQPWTPAGW